MCVNVLLGFCVYMCVYVWVLHLSVFKMQEEGSESDSSECEPESTVGDLNPGLLPFDPSHQHPLAQSQGQPRRRSLADATALTTASQAFRGSQEFLNGTYESLNPGLMHLRSVNEFLFLFLFNLPWFQFFRILVF